MRKSTIDPRVRAVMPAGSCCTFNKKAQRWYVYFEKKVYVKGGKAKSNKDYIGHIGNDFIFVPNELYVVKLKEQQAEAEKARRAQDAQQVIKKVQTHMENKSIEFRDLSRIRYRLDYIIFVSLLAQMHGYYSAQGIALYWKQNRKLFNEWFTDFPCEDISHDTIRRVFSMMPAHSFARILEDMTSELVSKLEPTVSAEGQEEPGYRFISVDGQASRASRIGQDNKTLYQLNFYDCDNRLTICTAEVGEKTNEITPAVKIANRLNFNGCIVTTDALITQKKFANAVINSQGHYCLAVKGNHQRLAEAIETTFERAKVIEANPRQQNIKIPGLGSWINRAIYKAEIELAHGRIEQRTTEVLPAHLIGLSHCEGWDGLANGTVARVVSSVTVKKTGQQLDDTRYYICSLPWDISGLAQKVHKAIRSHWAVENSLHYVLDVVMGQDQIQSITPNFICNMVTLRKLALNYLTTYQNYVKQKSAQPKATSINLIIKSMNTPTKIVQTLKTCFAL